MLLLLAATPSAQGAWLHCVATGTGADGPFAYLTTVVDAGTVKPKRLQQLQQLLTTHVAKADSEAHGTQAKCFVFDDQLVAQSHYAHTLDATVLKFGWEHLVVLPPHAWLADSDIADEPSRD
jgi:hypothetical protein